MRLDGLVGSAPALTSLPAIQALTASEAQKGLPVVVEGTSLITTIFPLSLFRKATLHLCGDAANARLLPGDRVQVRGKTHMDFRPMFSATR